MSEPEDQARAVDRVVGAALRARREVLRLSQGDVAAVLGVSRQQLDKYERGRDRIGAGSLAAAARHLGRDVGWFFEPENGVRRLESYCEVFRLEALLPDFAGEDLAVRVSFKRDAAAAWPGITIDVVALIEPGRAPLPLPRSLYAAMLRHGVAALRAAAAERDSVPPADAAPCAGAALH